MSAEQAPGTVVVGEDGGAVYLDGRVHELVERSDIDHHQNIKQEQLGEHLGGGFFLDPEPVLVERGEFGQIVRTTPLADMPGVELFGAGNPEDDSEAPPKVVLNRSERDKLVSALTMRLFNYYRNLPADHPKFNPLRDGIPEVADGDPLGLQPHRSEAVRTRPAPASEVFTWLHKYVGSVATVVDKRHGFGDARDYAVRFERGNAVG